MNRGLAFRTGGLLVAGWNMRSAGSISWSNHSVTAELEYKCLLDWIVKAELRIEWTLRVELRRLDLTGLGLI